MFKYGNTTYIINLDNLMKWVSTTPTAERNVISSITQIYPIMGENGEDIPEEALDYSTKEITEHKETLNETMSNIRYDVIKLLLNTLMLSVNIESEELSFQQKLALNTLINKGIIIEKI